MSEVPTLHRLIEKAYAHGSTAALLTLVQFCRDAGDQLEAELTQSTRDGGGEPKTASGE